MLYKRFNDKYFVRLEKNEEIIEELTRLCNKEGIKAGSIQGLGAAGRVVIGLFDPGEKEYHKVEYQYPMEITSLIGNISTKDGETYLHCHINVCDSEMNVRGGHLNECVISATGEIIVTVVEGTVERKFSDEIGLNLFVL